MSNQRYSNKSLKPSQVDKAKINQFQSKDKQKVIEMLLENDKVLLFIYEKLFPQTAMQSNA